MPLNKDGLEAGQPVDFETMQKVKLKQREDQKNGESESRRKPASPARKKKVREQAEPSVPSVDDSEEAQTAE